MHQSHLSALPKWAAFYLPFYNVSTGFQEVWSFSWLKSTDEGLNESATSVAYKTHVGQPKGVAWSGAGAKSSFNSTFPHVYTVIHVNMSCDRDKPSTTLMWDQAENDPEKLYRFPMIRDLHLIRRDFSVRL